MTKDEYAKLLVQINGGNEELGAEVFESRHRREQEVTATILEKYWGIICSGDAIHQFYTDTIREVSDRLTASTPQLLTLFLHWHILSASKHYAAFDLLKRGYYFESIALARTLWETALTLAGLQRKIVSFEELFGGRRESGTELKQREMMKLVKQADSRIQKHLLWENPELTTKSKAAVNVYVHLLNQANHKSNLGMAINIKLAERGEPIPILPKFNAMQVEVSWNNLFIATWCLMLTLAYLDILLPNKSSAWWNRYKSTLLSFEELNKVPPNSVLSGFGDVVNKVFKIPGLPYPI